MKIVADINIPFVKECFSSIGEVTLFGGREITAETVKDADILLVRSVTKVDSQLLAGSSIRFVATATIGYDHIDTMYLEKNDIGFASAPGSNANSVAEYVIAAILEISARHRIRIAGRSIGVVGVGNVGSRVAKKCHALGMEVVLNDPPLFRRSGDQCYQPIEKIFDCDFVTVHTPLSFDGVDKTFHLADKKFFNSLKDGCVFLNTSRGGVVDSGALLETSRSGRLKAAVLDVWENEPNIGVELLRMTDIGTPHIAGYSFDGKVAGMIMIYEAACRHFSIEPKFTVESFLPKPEVSELRIVTEGISEQQVIYDAVSKVYDITEDDRGLRGILDQAAGDRGAYFDRLRKNYPVRREFGNTKLIFERSAGQLEAKFLGIGFSRSESAG